MGTKSSSSKKSVKQTFNEKKEDNSGLLFVGFLLLGMGLGFLFDQLVAGLFIGLGVGFLGMFIAQSIANK